MPVRRIATLRHGACLCAGMCPFVCVHVRAHMQHSSQCNVGQTKRILYILTGEETVRTHGCDRPVGSGGLGRQPSLHEASRGQPHPLTAPQALPLPVVPASSAPSSARGGDDAQSLPQTPWAVSAEASGGLTSGPRPSLARRVCGSDPRHPPANCTTVPGPQLSKETPG